MSASKINNKQNALFGINIYTTIIILIAWVIYIGLARYIYSHEAVKTSQILIKTLKSNRKRKINKTQEQQV